MKAFQIVVTGVVQGVGFRYHTMQQAKSLGVVGTVENLADGTVFIKVEGESAAVMEFLDWCHRGPTTSKVQRLDYEQIKLSNFSSFEIKR